jgi:hypothetical protein
MDDLDFDPNTFTFSYPVWVCFRRGSDDVIGGKLKDGSRFVALFTDKDLAMRFITTRGIAEETDIGDIPNVDAFRGMLTNLQLAGFSHAVFDDTGMGGDARVVLDIAQVLGRKKG